MRNRALWAAALLATCAVGAMPAHATPTQATSTPTQIPATSSPALNPATSSPALNPATSTPIKHLVVIFQENVSFDHYFGTYPSAANPAGEPRFTPSAGTPSVNGLSEALLTNNPNLDNPFRLDRSQQIVCDQDHDYTPEQQAFDGGAMDMFVQFTGGCPEKQLTMGYYDGNTVTGLWNYAQRFAMSDNSYNTTFGPSTPGALNLVSGQTHGATPELPEVVENGSVIGDADPAYDDCSKGSTIAMSSANKNVGDMLNEKSITWGWFQGGFAPTATKEGKAVCGSSHINVGGAKVTDYSPHHEPFQYYQSTSNPHHLPPSSPAMIGKTDQANHQYDISDFYTALSRGELPAVSFLKAAKYQDGHAGYSDPQDEQEFVTRVINQLQDTSDWRDTAVVISYDDSDGFYDHQMSPIVNSSSSPADALNGPGRCGSGTPLAGYQDRCGYGPRLPLLVVSPWAKSNYVDHSVTDQSSILRFIEDNWGLGRIGDGSFDELAGSLSSMFASHPNDGRLLLNESTGEPLEAASGG